MVVCTERGATEELPVLELQNLSVEFRTRHGPLVALDRISLDIGSGEILGVVGESGAGKSVTGSAVIGLLEPPGLISGGRILLNGQHIETLSNSEMRKIRGKKIGAIFQDPLTSLNPLLQIGDQLVETIRTHLPVSAQEARRRALDLLKEVGIQAPEQRIHHYPHQFSGGMRQRVVIALALCAEPQLIIADEPTTALDVSVQAQVIGLLKKLCKSHHVAVMLITHDMGVIAETADRVAVMYAGRIAEIGSVDEVLRSPKHPYTLGLMESIPALGKRVDMLTQIEGYMPRLGSGPQGCAFNPRCPRVFERCRQVRPDLIDRGEGRVACWLYDPEVDKGKDAGSG